VLGKLTEWRNDPVAFVREVLRGEPDAWQERVLRAAAVKTRLAMSCSKGPGKTTTDVWLALWYAATRPHARIAVTSGSEKQLFDTLWPELAKWFARSFLIGSWFDLGKTRLSHKQAPDTWWCSARSWSRSAEEHAAGDSLAGLHEKYAMIVLDEAAQMPESLLVTAEAVQSTGSETRLVVSGNPISTSGALYRAAVTDKAHWHVTHVSGERAELLQTDGMTEAGDRIGISTLGVGLPTVVRAGASLTMIARYGRESPFVQVAVLGQFPTNALHTLLGREEIQVAMSRVHPDGVTQGMAIVLGVDVARYGLDATVFCLREGLRLIEIQIHRGLNNMETADRVCRLIDGRQVDETFIDAGAGSGVIDRCRQMGYSVQEVPFAASPRDRRFTNKRAEMFWDMAEWIRTSGSLRGASTDLLEELAAFSYAYKRDRMQVIDKEELRASLGRSPDQADALALTFAWPVLPRLTPAQTLYSRYLHRTGTYSPWDRGLGLPHSA
jgi:hypothetical protein